MKNPDLKIGDYLKQVQSAEAARSAQSEQPVREKDDAGFANWLDLLVMVCPGPLSEILVPATLARLHLSKEGR